MTLKYALLLTKGGIPITSFDFAKGGLKVDEVLFSGFISAIQPFLEEMKSDYTHRQQVGEITYGNQKIIYYSGEKSIGVLIGTDLDESIKDKLILILDEFEEFTADFQDIYSIDVGKIQLAGHRFIDTIISVFQKEVIHDYLIPVILEQSLSPNDFPENFDDVARFFSQINGIRTLLDISKNLGMSWNKVSIIASKLLSKNYIAFSVGFDDEQIYQITPYGMDLLFNRKEIPNDYLKNYWNDIVVPFLSEIDNQRTLNEIKMRMKRKIKKIDMVLFNDIIHELLFAHIIIPLPKVYILGNFLQTYYLNYHERISKKLGKTAQRTFFSYMDHSQIRPVLPDFENKRVQSLDKIFDLLRESSYQDVLAFVRNYLEPIKKTNEELKALVGAKTIEKLNRKVWEDISKDFSRIIEEYQIDKILFS